jgi:6-phosphofructokinase 1
MVSEDGAVSPSKFPQREELEIECLGEAKIPSPLRERESLFANEDDRVLVPAEERRVRALLDSGRPLPSFEPAGPRADLFFAPEKVSCGIVTCGGLCPGLNDVIRSVVMTLRYGYGVRRILGFRYGYVGLTPESHKEPMFLEPEKIGQIHQHGGTILGSSRGPRDLGEIVDTLVQWKINILFAIGGDGTLRGASAISEEISRRNLRISVIGIPKTIDNDLAWIERSFGFATAVAEAQTVLNSAHREAEGAWNGIGLVKLMGRQAGFIAASAVLTNTDADFCLIPEVEFTLEGRGGFLEALEKRLKWADHAMVVAAEGAGQDLVGIEGEERKDASGNVKFQDIGLFLKHSMEKHFSSLGWDFTVKYIDPSYTIRSLPANSMDSAFCLILGQHAVHAGMAGRTNMLVGFWNHRFTHVPLSVATAERKHLDPQGELWQRVLDTTRQPASMVGR